MSNNEKIEKLNNKINENNTDLSSVLETINSLPLVPKLEQWYKKESEQWI